MCPRCEATVQPEWTYCRECGYAPEPVAEAEPGADAIAVPAAGLDAEPEPAPSGAPSSVDAAPAAPGFGPSPGFGAPAAASGADDAPAPASPFGGDDVRVGEGAGWGPPAAATFDAPAPSAFSSGAVPAPFAPLEDPAGGGLAGDGPAAPGGTYGSVSDAYDRDLGRDPGDAPRPGPAQYAPTGGAFDPGTFDPDALAGTPYEEEPDDREVPPPAPVAYGAVAPTPGLPAPFATEPAPPRPPTGGFPAGGGGGTSVFSVNRVVAVVAVAVGAIILIGGIVLLTGGSKETVATNATPGKTTPPPLGALAVSTTTALDPLAPVPTTTPPVGAQRECDSPNIMHSVDGMDYMPCNAHFKVNFPGRPDTHQFDADLSMGRVQFIVHSSTSRDGKLPIRYEAAWSKLPKEPTPDETLESMGALTGKLGCSLTGPTTFQGQPAYACKGPGDGTPDPEAPTTAVGITFVRGDIVYALVANSYAPMQKELDAFAATYAAT